MRDRVTEHVWLACRRVRSTQAARRIGRRYIQISTTQASSEQQQTLSLNTSPTSTTADARFEVLGNPFSLLSASVSASQNLYTRKGTLIGFNGKAENAVSTLSLLEPLRRALVGIPFVYQRISSTSPYTALIGTKSTSTSLVVINLDGRIDWMIARRNALLAWTGHTLKLSPRLNLKLGLAYWGSTAVTGRGLLALSGKGLIHQLTLRPGEEYVVHPSNVVAYSMLGHAPQPYRFKSNSLRLQIPSALSWFPDTRFWQTLRDSTVWKYARNAAFYVRTLTRKTIWGDRLFLHFHGPATILVQSRATPITDVLTSRDVNEIADSQAGSVASKIVAANAAQASQAVTSAPKIVAAPEKVTYANVTEDGSVRFEKPTQPSQPSQTS